MNPLKQQSRQKCYPVDIGLRQCVDSGPKIRKVPECSSSLVKEDLSHILIVCHSLKATREKLVNFFISFASTNPVLSSVITKFVFSSDLVFQTQFLLDCSTLWEIIVLRQLHGFQVLQELFYLTRTWCFSLHRERLKRLGRWKYCWCENPLHYPVIHGSNFRGIFNPFLNNVMSVFRLVINGCLQAFN